MTFQEFIDTHLGKKLDWDGQYGYQCVDLFRFYCSQVLKIPQPKGVGGASEFWTKFSKDPVLTANFYPINNTPDGVPQFGDVILWNNKAGGGWGHVAMFIEGDSNQFTSLDQNWPVQSVTKTKHDYQNVYGWLHPKGNSMSNTTLLAECESKLAWYQKEFPLEQQRVIDARAERDDLAREFENYKLETQKTINDLKTSLKGAETEATLQRDALKELIASLAETLATTQEAPRIKAKVVELIEIEDLLNKERKLSEGKDETIAAQTQSINELKIQVETLEQQLREAKGLHSATYSQLLEAIVTKFINNIKRNLS